MPKAAPELPKSLGKPSNRASNGRLKVTGEVARYADRSTVVFSNPCPCVPRDLADLQKDASGRGLRAPGVPGVLGDLSLHRTRNWKDHK